MGKKTEQEIIIEAEKKLAKIAEKEAAKKAKNEEKIKKAAAKQAEKDAAKKAKEEAEKQKKLKKHQTAPAFQHHASKTENTETRAQLAQLTQSAKPTTSSNNNRDSFGELLASATASTRAQINILTQQQQTQQVKGLTMGDIYTYMPTVPKSAPLPKTTKTSTPVYGSLPSEHETLTSSVNNQQPIQQPTQQPKSTTAYGSMPEDPYQRIIPEEKQAENLYTTPALSKPLIPEPNNIYTSASKIEPPKEQYLKMPAKPETELPRPKNPHARFYQKTLPERELISDDEVSAEEKRKKQEAMKQKKNEWYQSSIIREETTRTERSQSSADITKYSNNQGKFYQSVLDPRLVVKPQNPTKPSWITKGPKPTNDTLATDTQQQSAENNNSTPTNNGFH